MDPAHGGRIPHMDPTHGGRIPRMDPAHRGRIPHHGSHAWRPDPTRQAMRPLLIERLSKKQKSLCALPRRFSSQAAATSPVATYVLTHNPWSWSGTPPLKFKDGGRLETPWGAGSWGVLDETHLFADFVGSRHNLEFEPSRMSKFTSARCGDGDPVVGVLAE